MSNRKLSYFINIFMLTIAVLGCLICFLSGSFLCIDYKYPIGTSIVDKSELTKQLIKCSLGFVLSLGITILASIELSELEKNNKGE